MPPSRHACQRESAPADRRRGQARAANAARASPAATGELTRERLLSPAGVRCSWGPRMSRGGVVMWWGRRWRGGRCAAARGGALGGRWWARRARLRRGVLRASATANATSSTWSRPVAISKRRRWSRRRLAPSCTPTSRTRAHSIRLSSSEDSTPTSTVDDAQERVSTSPPRLQDSRRREPATLWERFSVSERRDVLAGFVGRVVVSRGASSDLASHVGIEWLDGTVAHDEDGVRVTAA